VKRHSFTGPLKALLADLLAIRADTPMGQAQWRLLQRIAHQASLPSQFELLGDPNSPNKAERIPLQPFLDALNSTLIIQRFRGETQNENNVSEEVKEQLETKIKELEEKIAEMSEDKVQERIRILAEQVSQKEKDNGDLNVRLELEERRRKDLEAKSSEQQTFLDESKKRIKFQDEEIQQLELQLKNSSKSDRAAELEGLRASRERGDDDSAELKQLVDSQKKQIKDLQTQLEVSGGKGSVGAAAGAVGEAALTDAQEKIRALEAQLKTTKSQLADVKAKLDAAPAAGAPPPPPMLGGRTHSLSLPYSELPRSSSRS